MPYKDPTKQGEYLRNWRRIQKLSHMEPRPLHQMPTSPVVANSRRTILPALNMTSAPVVNQIALKTSPDGALQTGRSAVQAYQISRSQLSAPRSSANRTKIRRPPAMLPQITSRHITVPIASILVEVLSQLFS
jgi:hypothetical protein